MKQHTDLFDFSEYPANLFLYSEANKKVIGKMKDELCGEIASSFSGLKAKMYSLKSIKSEKKKQRAYPPTS